MNHPGRNLRQSWTWTEPDTATHAGGLRVRFEPHPEGGWRSSEVTGTEALAGLDSREVARLMREAGEFAHDYLGRR